MLGMQTHSQIHYHPNPSPVLNALHRNNKINARCLVYTPPGYDEERGGSYPVLYLLHGVGDVEFSWEVHGQASAILNELMRDKLIQPMIVLMPFGFDSNAQKLKRVFPDKAWFDGYLRGIMDEVEQAYKIQVGTTADGRYVKRGIAGLSMGGKQALEFGLDHLELFSAIGNFSGAIQKRSGAHALPELLATCKANQAKINNLALFYHGCGKADRTGTGNNDTDHWLIHANRRLVAELKTLGILHLWREMEGEHSWGVWKTCVREFLPIVASAWR
jgi:enterochelin esterase-like enzyme